VSEYNTVDPNGLFEGHLKYVDLQVIIEGEEYVHVQEKSKCSLLKGYDETKDAAFYQANEWHSFYLGKGFFAVFDENDLHRPCISVKTEKKVRKYVFKIKKGV
jgi:YhcH/YjgK/YiaL family protein